MTIDVTKTPIYSYLHQHIVTFCKAKDAEHSEEITISDFRYSKLARHLWKTAKFLCTHVREFTNQKNYRWIANI